jgi:hypothetical protein
MVDNRGQCSTKSTAEDNRNEDDDYIKARNDSPTIHPPRRIYCRREPISKLTTPKDSHYIIHPAPLSCSIVQQIMSHRSFLSLIVSLLLSHFVMSFATKDVIVEIQKAGSGDPVSRNHKYSSQYVYLTLSIVMLYI